MPVSDLSLKDVQRQAMPTASHRYHQASVILCIVSGRLLVPVENHDCNCVAFCMCEFVCKWLYTHLIQPIRVVSESINQYFILCLFTSR